MKLQKEVISSQKQPSCKKGAASIKNHGEKKMRNQKWWPRNGCDGRLINDKNFNNDNSDEFGAKS